MTCYPLLIFSATHLGLNVSAFLLFIHWPLTGVPDVYKRESRSFWDAVTLTGKESGQLSVHKQQSGSRNEVLRSSQHSWKKLGVNVGEMKSIDRRKRLSLEHKLWGLRSIWCVWGEVLILFFFYYLKLFVMAWKRKSRGVVRIMEFWSGFATDISSTVFLSAKMWMRTSSQGWFRAKFKQLNDI